MKIYQAHPSDSCGWVSYYEYQFAIQIQDAATVKSKDGYISHTNKNSYKNGFKWEKK